tara:strand:+ start:4750 stop:5724 length:975 start_codon:yes stop_codon:yes gene_type:complete
MINEVRNTVLSIANKNNFGYITPNDFNLYARQAQLDIFEDYFYQYNAWNVKQNVRQSGTGYADIVKSLEEVLDSFSATRALIYRGSSLYDLPENYYLINKINYYNTIKTTGNTTNVVANTLEDANADFVTDNIVVGDLVSNDVTGLAAFVTRIVSPTVIQLSNDIFDLVGIDYAIVSTIPSTIREIERVSQNKIFYLNSSPLTYPTTMYPAYVLGGADGTAGSSSTFGNTVTVYPDSIGTQGMVITQYIRYPRVPNWTYVQIGVNQEPSFDESNPDYQDFELPESDAPNLINKILQYAGVSIRDNTVAAFGKAEETEANNQEGQ